MWVLFLVAIQSETAASGIPPKYYKFYITLPETTKSGVEVQVQERETFYRFQLSCEILFSHCKAPFLVRTGTCLCM